MTWKREHVFLTELEVAEYFSSLGVDPTDKYEVLAGLSARRDESNHIPDKKVGVKIDGREGALTGVGYRNHWISVWLEYSGPPVRVYESTEFEVTYVTRNPMEGLALLLQEPDAAEALHQYARSTAT